MKTEQRQREAIAREIVYSRAREAGFSARKAFAFARGIVASNFGMSGKIDAPAIASQIKIERAKP